MESVRIQQHVRPHRFAFVIKSGDHKALMDVAAINTALWGGNLNPVVPLRKRMKARERERLWGLLRDFDPDFLVNLYGLSISGDLQTAFKHRILEDATFFARIDEKRRFVKAVDIMPLLHRAWEEEVRLGPGETNASHLLDQYNELTASFGKRMMRLQQKEVYGIGQDGAGTLQREQPRRTP